MEHPPIDGTPAAEAARKQTRSRGVRIALFVVAGTLLSFAVRSEHLQAVLNALSGHRLEVSGAPVAAGHPRLSEHNIEWVKEQPAQAQAEFLLSSAINYEEGATDLIAQSVDRWRGQLQRTPEWEQLTKIALYSSDLRVRAAAMEIDLAVNDVQKNEETARELMRRADADESMRPWAAWTLGMLANRGILTDTIHAWLVEYTFDPAEQVRLWAVEGLAHIGTDETIAEFLRVLATDPSMAVRERAGCSLAKSGMLTRGQRLKAVPGLIELAENPNLEEQPLRWVYQALREITAKSLPDDPGEWRYWYSVNGAELERTFGSEGWRVLGNS
ncbi:MAG: HEAT repeat domain-containing protein [bacterium]|nr:HEAT repeat domain-containing protein [bacterium]